MKNPNGYGAIVNLGKNRRKPYGVRVTTGFTSDGKQIRKYVGYYKTRKEAMEQLNLMNATSVIPESLTLGKVFELWSEKHYPTIGDKSISMYNSAWNWLKKLENKKMNDVKLPELESVIEDMAGKSRSLQGHVKSLAKQLFNFAIPRNYVTDKKNYAEYLVLDGKPAQEKQVFSKMEISVLWDNQEDDTVKTILILIYTGMRISEMLTTQKSMINFTDWYIRHGSKTEAGKNRIIPIPKRIRPLVLDLMDSQDYFVEKEDGGPASSDSYRRYIYYKKLQELGIRELSPHSTRHTYASMLSKSVDDKVLISRIMGHTDYKTTANIYTHKEIGDLTSAVENI